MKIPSQLLLDDLCSLTRKHTQIVKDWLTEDPADFFKKASPEGWNALECIAHLNRYSKFYNKEIAEALNTSKADTAAYYSSGIFGEYFAKVIHPDHSKKQMNTPAAMNTLNAPVDKNEFEEFIRNQEELLELLLKARKVHLGKVKTGTSISKFIRLKLGDTLRFVIYHNERHIRQAGRAMIS